MFLKLKTKFIITFNRIICNYGIFFCSNMCDFEDVSCLEPDSKNYCSNSTKIRTDI